MDNLFAANTSASFLNIPVNARALGLGTGIVALGDDAGSVTHNPAGLGRLRGKQLNILYAPHLQGMDVGFLSYAQPTALGSLGVSYLTLRSGTLDGRDDAGNQTAGFAAEDRSIALSFGRTFLKSRANPDGLLRFGGNLKYITSRIASFSASTYAMDLGAQAPMNVGWVPVAFGAAVRNIGPGMKFLDRKDPLPLSAAFGAAAQPFVSMVLAAGLTRSINDAKTEFTMGAEYSPISMIAVRGSYGVAWAERAGGAPTASLAGGVGLKFGDCRFDYAFAPLGDLGNTQRMSVTFQFGSSDANPQAKRHVSRRVIIEAPVSTEAPKENVEWMWPKGKPWTY